MAIPPFPSQDLAKLVLGYLAEEQLMTVYDEFLQASPYLDALRNEYDRIFMTSLKSILSEYRAVKIYVDTCKPFVLRKRIFQCTNLLDVVKFLVTNVDINKIKLQEATEKSSLEKQKVTTPPKANTCDVCDVSKLANCVCKGRQIDVKQSDSMSTVNVETSTLQNSVETTPLADLPGNHITSRKKHIKVLEKESILSNSNLSSGQNSETSVKQSFSSTISPEEYLANCETPVKSDNSALSVNLTVKTTDQSKSIQNFEEFDNVLKTVVDKNKTLSNVESQPNQQVSNASTFKDFASGVSSGESKSASYSVPDSSTSENSNIRASLTKTHYNNSITGPPQHQLMLQVSHVNDNIEIQTCRTGPPNSVKVSRPTRLHKIRPKPTDTKIKIISDVKVGRNYSDTDSDHFKNKLLASNNATSTPLMQMQTIMINGTPAYKHTLDSKFTKDEIMAMPTLIVVPASGSSRIPTTINCEPITTHSCDMISKTSSSPQVLGPLVIDVPSNTAIQTKSVVTALPDLSEPKSSGLVKTVDNKNASVPKDNVISLESNTPQVLPPTRKSSSTPRRTSHVRVLDFATPRRILHETINEQVSSQSSDPPLEIILSSSPNMVVNTPISNNETPVVLSVEGNNTDSGSAKENNSLNKVKQAKKYDWDADLRALVASEQDETKTSQKKTPKTKAKTLKKKKSSGKTVENSKTADSDKTESQKKPRMRKKSPKIKKNIKKIEDNDETPLNLEKKCDIPVKPIVNIINSNYHDKTELQISKNDAEIITNKISDKDNIETPEAERLSLQNVIGAKLNISDLLETPYKQALYDIQMETPRFLGPDIPGEPVSDIKIMNIPTPRFLNTPQAVQATPSSYSSRPTDYSSGGSYYKPDDQDYMPIPELLTCPVTSSKEDISEERSAEKDNDERKSRPVRQCTKNVSYYRNSSVGNKTRDVEDNVDAASTNSDSISVNSSFECKNKMETIPNTVLEKSQSNKAESKKRNSKSRKRKLPNDTSVNDKPKSFMKIKPRYTPRKETPSARNRKKSMQSPHSKKSPKSQRRKRTISKDKTSSDLPVVVALPTKSRRKSSTPRKLHCTKNFNSESSGHDSPEIIVDNKPMVNTEKTVTTVNDSDNEQLALRWSDDGSQDTITRELRTPAIEIENIAKIQEFIESSNKCNHPNTTPGVENPSKRCHVEESGTLQRDLMNRGFDLETAKIIERDLLDDTPLRSESATSENIPITVQIVETKKDGSVLEKIRETDSNNTSDLQIQEDGDEDEIEFSVHECNENSNNYIVFEHKDTKETCKEPPIKLKDNFTMEICIDDVTMRLKATPFILVLDQDPPTVDEIDYSYKETERAVDSISNMDRLYTPLKDTMKAQCYEIFDSTLTSLDTPLKANSPIKSFCKTTVTELVLEVEKDKTEGKKRKRQSVSDEPANSSKRTKPDADLLLKTANIQNIDIETVLTKLHGH